MKSVELTKIAEQFHNPKKFLKDLMDTAVSMQTFYILYGDVGIETLDKLITGDYVVSYKKKLRDF